MVLRHTNVPAAAPKPASRAHARRAVLAYAIAAPLALSATSGFAPSASAAEPGPSSNAPVPAGAVTQPDQTLTARTVATPRTAANTPVATSPATTTPAATPAPAGGTTAPATAPQAAGVPGTPARRAAGTTQRAGKGGGGISDGAIVLAAVAALLALAACAWALARMAAWEPRWTLSLRHALAEAGHRASLTWAELGDWIRLGR